MKDFNRFIIGRFFIARICPRTFVRVQQNQVHLRSKEKTESNSGADTDTHHQTRDLNLDQNI